MQSLFHLILNTTRLYVFPAACEICVFLLQCVKGFIFLTKWEIEVQYSKCRLNLLVHKGGFPHESHLDGSTVPAEGNTML